MGLHKPLADRYFTRFVETGRFYDIEGRLAIRPCGTGS